MEIKELKQKAYKMFFDIRREVKDETLLKLYDKAWDALPDYWFTKTASSTGKYHPRFANGELGLAKHSLYASKVWKYLWRGFKQEFNDDELIYQAGIIGIVFHDAIKYGDPAENRRYTTNTHPEDAAEWMDILVKEITNDFPNHERAQDFASFCETYICRPIRHHQGPWSTYGAPKTLMQQLIFIADFVASQPTFEEEIFKCE